MLGPSGSGKTTLLRAILGLERAQRGQHHRARRRGARSRQPPHRLHPAAAAAPARHGAARPRPRRARRRRTPLRAAASRGAATASASRPRSSTPSARASSPTARWAMLSGGEQQRLRVGQALADDPQLLLCDEPLTSLDLANQQAVVGLIDRHRRDTGAAVLLVTHDINPVLGKVDRILYLANGRFTLGTPDEVLRSRRADRPVRRARVRAARGRPARRGRRARRRGVAPPPRTRRSHAVNWADIWDAMFGGLADYGEILALVVELGHRRRGARSRRRPRRRLRDAARHGLRRARHQRTVVRRAPPPRC